MRPALAVVVIGRNEGARLEACLASLAGVCETIVYVDSGSTDGSPNVARARNAEVVELERNRPFTAARGRNAGFERACALNPALEFVQFIDGDCELDDHWTGTALRTFSDRNDLAAVAGRRRERHPDASVYNRIADIEWDTPIGEDGGFGGDVMMRAAIFRELGGYDESLIAGEDPDLCLRLQLAGHAVLRLDAAMTTHDANMHRFSQFWRRQVRGGHAYAERLALHGRADGGATLRSVASIAVYGLLLPVAFLAALFAMPELAIFVLAPYPILWWRVRASRLHDQPASATAYATLCVVGKFAEAWGVLRYAWNRFVRRRNSELIEYKNAA